MGVGEIGNAKENACGGNYLQQKLAKAFKRSLMVGVVEQQIEAPKHKLKGNNHHSKIGMNQQPNSIVCKENKGVSPRSAHLLIL